MLLTFVNVYWLRRGKGRREKREERRKKNGGERGREKKREKKCHLIALCLTILIWLMERKRKKGEQKKKLSVKLRSGTYCPAIQYLYYVKRKEYSYFE